MMEQNDPAMDRAMRRVAAATIEGSRPDERAFLAAVEAGIASAARPSGARVLPAGNRAFARALSGVAAILVLSASAAGLWRYTRPAAVLAFQTAAVSTTTEVARGTRLNSHAAERAILSLDDRRILMHMNESTSLRIKSAGEVELTEGEVWCDVRPHSGRFIVSTPHGTVTVTGTRFGVATAAAGTRVQLLDGEVRFEHGPWTGTLGPGAEACVGANPDETPVVTPGLVKESPAWARDLLALAAAEATARYYPSGAPGN